ncbi:NAD(P)H-binding protein [Sulfitobacter albidus]|uniref:Divinyl chlorophyllide a 8-vinyl-reductase, chloroplastic n=1 Tax=Sulfitobacter albidus TaxID=2829501 RepID=A0A975JDQ3_9RHOB|nr:NAD(P)H-binding protein [Sulfitobacter albidus]QUJ76589.1 NAD(P)H-binding protein [Sulfitobacter albidus]
MTKHRIMLFGATGTAGAGALVGLRDAGHEVVCFGRSAPEGGAEFVRGDVTDPRQLRAAFAGRGITAVVSCLASRSGAPRDAWAVDHGAQLAVLAAGQAAGVGHLVLLSAICVQRPKLAFQQAKLAFEAALIASGLRYSIVRPTAFFKSLSGQVARVRAGRPFMVFGDGRLTACKPISDRDLGRYIAGCLDDPARWDAVLPIGGPGPAITPLDQVAMLSDLLGRAVPVRRVPVALLDTIAGGLGALGKLYAPAAEKAQLARIGRYYATESMLVWDGARYDAQATPTFGSDTLRNHYAALLAGQATVDLGAHGVF